MSRRRRIFDVDLPPADDIPADLEVKSMGPRISTVGARRGPMAAAITENAEALAERRAAEERIRAENDALAHELVRLKKGLHG